MKEKTAVIIHAHFLRPQVWETVMWGRPGNGDYGVIPTGLRLALSEQAELVYLCSGVPMNGGRDISHNALDFVRANLGNIPEFCQLSKSEIDTFVLKIHQDEFGQTTREEVRRAESMSSGYGIQRVFSVTPPKHAPRALQELLICRQEGGFKGVELFTTASDVNFPDTDASSTVIMEPPHRADTIGWNFHLYSAAMLKLMYQRPPESLEAVLDGLGMLLRQQGMMVNWEPHP